MVITLARKKSNERKKNVKFGGQGKFLGGKKKGSALAAGGNWAGKGIGASGLGDFDWREGGWGGGSKRERVGKWFERV